MNPRREPVDTCGPMRENAKSCIEQIIKRLRIKADGLEALLRNLPEHIDSQADAALWDLVSRIRE